jgi:hypothetical protein
VRSPEELESREKAFVLGVDVAEQTEPHG